MLGTSLIARFCAILVKMGMPLVYIYHLLVGSFFLNVAAEDATGMEKVANVLLLPCRYLLEGKRAILLDGMYHFEREFTYDRHFYFKTTCALALLPISLPMGALIKLGSYWFMETKQRAKDLQEAWKVSLPVRSLEKYREMGLEVCDWTQGKWSPSPRYKRRPEDAKALKRDIEALRTIVEILKEKQIPFWMDCGSCLGAYRYGGVIPWDWDIDIAVLSIDFDHVRRALLALDPKKYVVQDWSGRDKPNTYLKVYVKKSRSLIDLYHFGIDPEKQELFTVLSNEWNIFLTRAWKIRELRYTIPMPFSRVFPLKRALFEGIEVPVPNQIEEYLHAFYGENLAPARIYNEKTKQYEVDSTHPYWQLPGVQS